MAEIQGRRARESHFEEEAWADFARGQTAPAQRLRMEGHLDSGCEPCIEMLGVWTSLAGLAAAEPTYEPPADVLAQAKGQFALRRPAGLFERAAQAASLVFDSFRTPVLAGVRAARSSPRHFLYKAGRYLIRLQVDREAATQRLFVLGQIVDEQSPQNPLQDLPVILLSDEQPQDRALTNTLGEFELTSDPSESLRLSVGIPEIGTLTLPGLLGAAPASSGAKVSGTRGGSSRRIKARHVRAER
jgi:hypothetical protein